MQCKRDIKQTCMKKVQILLQNTKLQSFTLQNLVTFVVLELRKIEPNTLL